MTFELKYPRSATFSCLSSCLEIKLWLQLWKLQDHRVFFHPSPCPICWATCLIEHPSNIPLFVVVVVFFGQNSTKTCKKKNSQTVEVSAPIRAIEKKTFPWNWFGFRFSILFSSFGMDAAFARKCQQN